MSVHSLSDSKPHTTITGHDSDGASTRINYLPHICWLLVFASITACIHLYFPYPLDNDTAYHLAVARMIRKYGVLHSFPWTQFSTQMNHYADKEFLFHLLFLPVNSLELVTASRVVGIVTGTMMLTALYTLFCLEKVKLAGLWTILPLLSYEFLFRFTLVRPHLLSLTLMIMLLWAAAHRKLAIIAVVSLLYPLSYVAFWQIPLIILAATESARFISSRQITFKPTLVSVVAIAAGVALHPNSVNLLSINWLHMADALFNNAWGKAKILNMGSEIYPYSLHEWLKYLAIASAMLAYALYRAVKNRKNDMIGLSVVIAAVVFCALTIESRRFLEYFVPLSAAALALTCRTSTRSNRLVLSCAIAVSLVLFYASGLTTLKGAKYSGEYFAMDAEFKKVLETKVPPGAQVFTTGWHYTGDLMLVLPERRFLVATEPTMMYKLDKNLYNYWYFIPMDLYKNPAGLIRTMFKSRFVVSENKAAYWKFFNSLNNDPTVKSLYAGKWRLYDLGDGSRPGIR
jgi:hypothetical protein